MLYETLHPMLKRERDQGQEVDGKSARMVAYALNKLFGVKIEPYKQGQNTARQLELL